MLLTKSKLSTQQEDIRVTQTRTYDNSSGPIDTYEETRNVPVLGWLLTKLELSTQQEDIRFARTSDTYEETYAVKVKRFVKYEETYAVEVKRSVEYHTKTRDHRKSWIRPKRAAVLGELNCTRVPTSTCHAH